MRLIKAERSRFDLQKFNRPAIALFTFTFCTFRVLTTFSMKLPFLSLLLGLLLLTECRHNTPAPAPSPDPLSLLPPETQTGQRTFGCLVNGQPYATVTSIQCNGDWQGIKTIAINGTASEGAMYGGIHFGSSMLLNGLLQSGQKFNLVAFNQAINPVSNEFVLTASVGSKPCFYQGNYIKTGQITLTKFDGVARIASGRFAFTIYEPGGCDTLHVTNGRFDVKF